LDDIEFVLAARPGLHDGARRGLHRQERRW
jgi:hypothetical protein